jgi:hypothetical protein
MPPSVSFGIIGDAKWFSGVINHSWSFQLLANALSSLDTNREKKVEHPKDGIYTGCSLFAVD